MTESTTFYWYDFETFGLDCRRDRPAQFAGIRTDMDLNPQGDGDVFYSRPSGDYLPSPESCLLTGMTPQICEERGIPESEFAGEVWSRLNRPGTISIGYNASGFDNEVALPFLAQFSRSVFPSAPERMFMLGPVPACLRRLGASGRRHRVAAQKGCGSRKQ